MKLLKDDQYNVIKVKSDSFDAIVSAMVANSEDVKPEEITSEVIIQALQNGSTEGSDNTDSSVVAALQKKLDAATAEVSELKQQLSTANTRIEQLEKDLDETPGDDSAEISVKSEVTGEQPDIISFAKKNEDDPFAVIAEMKKQRLL